MSSGENLILARLPSDARAHLAPLLKPRELGLREVIENFGEPPRAVIFPTSGIVSVVAGPAGQEAEVGIVGRLELTGAWAFLGAETSPSASFVQAAGEGLSIAWSDLTAAMAEFPSIHAACLYGTGRLMQQITDTAWSNARATLAERAARWILLCHERVTTETIPMTHEFLALMLGVRRPGVTIALQTLEGAGVIRNTRGHIVVRNIDLLEEIGGRGLQRAREVPTARAPQPGCR